MNLRLFYAKPFIALLLIIFLLPVRAEESFDKESARHALQKAVAFFRQNAGYQGAYVYKVSADLKLREGEGKATATMGWIQPPGTPTIGEAYLEAWRLTGEPALLEAALEVATALEKTQLVSGGWRSSMDLKKTERNSKLLTTLDDNKTQSCLMFLMHLDEQLQFKNKQVRKTLDYAFDRALAAQYPNGAWPQQFREPPVAEDFPVKKARYPESWSREFPREKYHLHYTFNDNSITDMMRVMLEAWRIYKDEKFLNSARKTGEFLLLAQMPEPQPGWAQQYNANMEPAWARKFEPASLNGGEAQGVMRALLELYKATGDLKFLDPIPRALEYYRSSLRADGKLARFYELHTNKPLYFTKDYQLTYSDADMPTHYSFIVGSKLDGIEKQYQKLKATPPDKLNPHQTSTTLRMSKGLKNRAREAAIALDSRGAWVESGGMKNYEGVEKVIDSKTFTHRLIDLARYISAR